MQRIIRQLENVRRLGRAMLFAQRLVQWSIGVSVALAICGFADYALRLPGWLRLLVGCAVAGAAAAWLLHRAARIVRFHPTLGQLALRLERLYPQLRGSLASAIEFVDQPQHHADSIHMAALVHASIGDAQQRLEGVSVSRLVDPTRTWRWLAIGAIVGLGFAAIAGAVGQGPLRIATARWLSPFDAPDWPKRVHVESLMAADVAPSDSRVRLRAGVDRGFHRGMDVLAHYRITFDNGRTGPWKRMILNHVGRVPLEDQSNVERVLYFRDLGGVFEQFIDMPAELAAAGAGARAHTIGATLELRFEAGDDATVTQRISIVDPPRVMAVVATITPPDYAGLRKPTQELKLHEQGGQTITVPALEHSTIALRLRFNKPLPSPRSVSDLLPDLPADVAVSLDSTSHDPTRTATVRFALDRAIASRLIVRDEHGLQSAGVKKYRFEPMVDRAPTATLSTPPADESVLATARIPIKAMGRDDVGMRDLKIAFASPGESADRTKRVEQIAAIVEGSEATLSLEHVLDLSPLTLQPGDVVELYAIARDGYRWDGEQHDAVRSAARRLRIIEPAQLVTQLRNELTGLRQQLLRLIPRQQQAADAKMEQASREQERINQSIQRHARHVRQLIERAEANRLDAAQLMTMLHQSEALMARGEREAKAAASKLEEARRAAGDTQRNALRNQARQMQREAAARLTELSALLDQGRDALTLQLQLQQLERTQEDLLRQTREQLTETLGREANELSKAQREALDQLRREQAKLGEDAASLVRRMQRTAEVLAREGKSPDEIASSQALNQAARQAGAEGLSQRMLEAAEAVEQNQLGGATANQQSALETLQSMRRQLEDQRQRQVAVLRRALIQLEASIEKLVTRQTSELDRLRAAKALGPLEQPLVQLRRDTIVIEEEARQAKQEPTREHLHEATERQADAVLAMRDGKRIDADRNGMLALKQLQAALEEVRKKKNEAEKELTNDQRRELREAYEKLAARQDAIRERTLRARPDEGEALTRRARAELRKLAGEESELATAAKALQGKLNQTLVFEHLHQQVDQRATRVAEALRGGASDLGVTMDQFAIAIALRQMASALDEAIRESKFASPPAGGGSGGEGGDGQQQQMELVPPITELKLLRAMQQAVYEQTRTVANHDKADAKAKRRLIDQLGGQQVELSTLAERLIRKMEAAAQQSNQAGGNEPIRNEKEAPR